MPIIGLLAAYPSYSGPDDRYVLLGAHCPACDFEHGFRIDSEYWAHEGKDVWEFNGDYDLPTFVGSDAIEELAIYRRDSVQAFSYDWIPTACGGCFSSDGQARHGKNDRRADGADPSITVITTSTATRAQGVLRQAAGTSRARLA